MFVASTRKDRRPVGTSRNSMVMDCPPPCQQGVPTGLTAKVGAMGIATPFVERLAVLLKEEMESPKVKGWTELLEAYPVNTSCGQKHTQVHEWIPPIEEIEKRLERVLVLSNKSFPRAVAVRQVAMRVRNWALRYGKRKAIEMILIHLGGDCG
jgi:hypothetical protein